MPMRRADRQTPDDDNARNNPHSKKEEPVSNHELKQLLTTARSQRDDWRQRATQNEQAATQLVHIQQDLETYKLEAKNWEQRVTQTAQLYTEVQQKYQQTFSLYNEEKARTSEWLTKYEQANAEKQQYLTLYNDVKEQLKFERRSKASIKGWETRRKHENNRLKREIGEMTVLLHQSLARKDEAVNNLYILAERMDRIQQLVDSVEEANTPMSLLQKLQRIWAAVKDILSE